jgi:hypothetical protein
VLLNNQAESLRKSGAGTANSNVGETRNEIAGIWTGGIFARGINDQLRIHADYRKLNPNA